MAVELKSYYELCDVPPKEGWVWKRAVGKSFLFSAKNWKMRYVIANIEGIKYYAQEPFEGTPRGEIKWADVTHIYDSCGTEVDKDACDVGKYYYYGLRFNLNEEQEKLLLMRAESEKERASWVSNFKALHSEFARITELFNEDDDDEITAARESIFESVHRKLRNLVSLKKQRYQKDGLDLDLAYILPGVIAMGYPSEGKEAVYRNPMDQVVEFFSRYHPQHFKIYNLCSERAYPPSRFHGSFARFPFDDHNPPPVELLLPCVDDIHQFLLESRTCAAGNQQGSGLADPPPCALEGPAMLDIDVEGFQKTSANVVAIHCKAGKGRTGLIICCYLLYAGACPDAPAALKIFGDRRTKDGKGVQIPSQKRYLQYFDTLLKQYNGVCPPAMVVNIKSIILSTTPRFDPDGGCDPYVKIHRRKADHNHLPQGYAEGNFSHPMEEIYNSQDGHVTEHVVKQKNVEIPMNFKVHADDFRVTLMDLDKVHNDDKMCSFWLHSAFLPLDGRYTMTKNEIDDAVKDKSNKYFTSDFTITVLYDFTHEPVSHPNPCSDAAAEHLQAAHGGSVQIPAQHPTAYILGPGDAHQSMRNMKPPATHSDGAASPPRVNADGVVLLEDDEL